MAISVYEVKLFGAAYRIRADFSKPDSLIELQVGSNRWARTDRHVSDYKKPHLAMRGELERHYDASRVAVVELSREVAKALAAMTTA